MLRARRRRKKPDKSIKFFRRNHQIRAPEVTVIDDTGASLGILNIAKALDLAVEKELDLVEVFPKANPPVCKIMEYGQFLYQQSKKIKAQKAQVKKSETKEIRISYRIGQHDLDFKLDNVKKFLEKGHKVKLEMRLKRRERAHTREAVAKLQEIVNLLAKETVIEKPLKANGGQISVTLAPQK